MLFNSLEGSKMSNSKKVFIGALSLVLAGSISAFAQTDTTAEVDNPAILFKIHDIKPVASTDGQITSCDFAITVFNRTNEGINGATLDLTWSDEAIKVLIDEEKKNENNRNSNTARNTRETVTSTVEIPAIKSMQQTIVRTRLQSDRCFLLMGDVTTKVRSCNIASQSRSGSRSATVCGNLFRFVSANDPEYYREFTNISVEQEAAQNFEEKEKIKKEINDEYGKTVAEFEKASQMLLEIK